MEAAGRQALAGLTQAPLGEFESMAGATAGILLVEDEAFVRHVTCEVLEAAGYRVFKARNAREAVTTFRENSIEIQLLLTDVVLPGQSGRELAQQLRHLKAGLKTIFVSGYPKNGKGTKGIAGVSFLEKPFSSEGLLRKVREVLSPEDLARQAAAGG